ncbi:YopX protein [compost metagenome]
MREYKFRVWHKAAEQMLHGQVPGDCFRWAREGQPLVIMQYTELHDDTEDDNELFEGDIVAITWADEKHICKIEFSAGTFMFVADSLPDGYLPLHELAEYDRRYGWIEGAKKLGNIYTSPELLGG